MFLTVHRRYSVTEKYTLNADMTGVDWLYIIDYNKSSNIALKLKFTIETTENDHYST